MTLADQFGQFSADVKLINEVGASGVCGYVQIMGARLVSIGRTQELALENKNKIAISVEELVMALKEKEKEVSELTSSLKTKGQQHDLEDNVRDLRSKKEKFEAQIKELETKVYDTFAQGFDRAVDQVNTCFQGQMLRS
ncbi:uncharacterized protein LOC107612775 [Arachis ipaensis]|uniref:uncharacterized protein LOC107612775 n=1 Tax=Arachis ipaensis TaxID=130454 RepID=UPI0007AF97F7|nr:uncharacterized protein LOC107612775 [Arachis ipaensis]XP_025673276.1 uncharacterized protein LOC112772521 [Arachis hypogaea]XP_029150608.1 uncharacterized protein LOC112772521 [Arachis hypogaea]QHN96310.1 uncharacterized protein DS421_18g617360 [Arachis hypogaea]